MPQRNRLEHAAVYGSVVLLLMLGLVLRLKGILWGLPSGARGYSYHPDELNILGSLLGMAPFSLNPHDFTDPSFHTYVVGTVLLGLRVIGAVSPLRAPLAASDLAGMILAGRLVSVLLGVATIFMTYELGRRWYGRSTGLLAAVFVAVLPLHVVHSHYLTVAVPSTFWVMLVFVSLTEVRKKASGRNYATTGAAAGLAASTQYDAALCIPVVIFAHYYFCTRRDTVVHLFDRRVLIFLATAVVAFVGGTPYALLAPIEFARDLAGHGGAGPPYPVIPLLAYCLTVPLLITVVFGSVVALFSRTDGDVILFAWFALYAILILVIGSSLTRQFVLLGPFLVLAAARTFVPVLRASSWRSPSIRLAAPVAACAAFVCGWTFLASYAYVELMTRPDVRDIAARWIDEHVPSDASIGLTTVTRYDPASFAAPTLNRDRYRVEHMSFDPGALVRARPQYVILNDLPSSGRSSQERSRDSDEADERTFLELLDDADAYRTRMVFEVTPVFPPLARAKGKPPADWMYTYPTIRLLERVPEGPP